MTTISTSPAIGYRHPPAEVWVADHPSQLGTLVPYLRVESLRVAAGPEIDAAELSYVYGSVLPEDGTAFAHRPPLDLRGKFVRIVIGATVAGDDPIVWYGIVEEDERMPHGTRQVGGTRLPTGRQSFRAYGLARLLERAYVASSLQVDGYGFADLRIGRGRTFNVDSGGLFPRRGNRAALLGADGAPVFSYEETSGRLWTAREAADYLLRYHAPTDAFGGAAIEWQLEADPGVLDWHDITVETDRRTVKQILDELIPRKRGVGYAVDYVREANTAVVRVFTFARSTIVLPDGATTIAANPDQVELDVEDSLDVEAELRSTDAHHYDLVVAEGEYQTSIFTAPLDPEFEIFEPAWTSAERDEYLRAASGDPNYVRAPLHEQARMNSEWRRRDDYRHVFARWRFRAEWDQTVVDPDDPDPHYRVAPEIPPTGEPDWKFAARRPLWTRGLRLLPRVPLTDLFWYRGTDDDEPQRYLAPIAVAYLNERWVDLSQLASVSAHAKEQHRPFSVQVEVDELRGSFELRVVGRPQHFLALREWNEGFPLIGSTDPDEDPASQTAQAGDAAPRTLTGIDWREIRVTLCAELDDRVSAEVRLRTPPPGIPDRVLRIAVPGARLDMMLPHVIAAATADPTQLIHYIAGKMLNDDRPRLQAIARAAAEWYGRPRMALRLTSRQIRQFVRLGQLVTSFGANYSIQEVNSPVTAITWRLGSSSPGTTIETSYDALDFVPSSSRDTISHDAMRRRVEALERRPQPPARPGRNEPRNRRRFARLLEPLYAAQLGGVAWERARAEVVRPMRDAFGSASFHPTGEEIEIVNRDVSLTVLSGAVVTVDEIDGEWFPDYVAKSVIAITHRKYSPSGALLITGDHGNHLRDCRFLGNDWLICGAAGTMPQTASHRAARRLDAQGVEQHLDAVTDQALGIDAGGGAFVVSTGLFLRRYDGGGNLLWNTNVGGSGRCRIDPTSGDTYVIFGSRLARVDSLGAIVWNVIQQFPPDQWRYLFVDAAGPYIYVTSQNSVGRYIADGTQTNLRTFANSHGITGSPAGTHIYVASGNRIRKHDAESLFEVVGGGWPFEVTPSANLVDLHLAGGKLYAVGTPDAAGDNVYQIDLATLAIDWRASHPAVLWGVSSDAGGNVYVAGNRI